MHSQWVVSNKNLKNMDLKDSRYMLYNEMMAFLVTNVNVSDDQQPEV